jgi:hypothetical protein
VYVDNRKFEFVIVAAQLYTQQQRREEEGGETEGRCPTDPLPASSFCASINRFSPTPLVFFILSFIWVLLLRRLLFVFYHHHQLFAIAATKVSNE